MLATWLWFRLGVDVAPVQKGESDCESGSPWTLLTFGHHHFCFADGQNERDSTSSPLEDLPPIIALFVVLAGMPCVLSSLFMALLCQAFLDWTKE